MSLLPNKSHLKPEQPLYLPYFATGLMNASTISTQTLIAGLISSQAVEASSITTNAIDLDGQILTATPTELLLNGVPVATQSSLSSIADWSLDPAISTVQMAGNNLTAAGNISTTSIVGGTAFFTNLMALNSMFLSTYTSTISSLDVVADDIKTSSFGAASGQFSTITVNSQLSPSNGILLPLDPTQATGGILFGLSTGSVYNQYNGLTTSYINDYKQSTQLGVGFVRTLDAESTFTYGDFFTGKLAVAGSATAYGAEKAAVIDADASGVLYLGANVVSTPALYVSSINGSEFNSTGITVQVAGVSSLVANSISSIGAELRTALVSTLQFKPEFGLDFNFGLGDLGNGLKQGLTNIGVGVGAGVGLVGTGIIAAATARTAATTVVSNTFEQIATPTQLQFSTLGTATSSFFRYVSSSGEGNVVPGTEIIQSSIIPAGSLCIRSVGDPINLVDPSTFTSTIQSYSSWVPLPAEIIGSTVSTYQTLGTSSLSASTISLGPSTLLYSETAFNELLIASLADSSDLGQVGCAAVRFLSSTTAPNGILTYTPGNDRLTFVNSSVVSNTLAYLTDIPPAQPLVSSFQDLYTSSLAASTVAAAWASISSLLDVSTINGAAYPPPQTQLVSTFADLTTSSLVASTIVGLTASLSSLTDVSTINGAVYPPPQTVLVSTFQDLHTSSLEASTITLPSTGILQGSIGIGGGSAISSFQSVEALNLRGDSLQSYLTGNILVGNNLAGLDGISAQFSTLIADELTSTAQLEVSSINGYAWSNVTSLNQASVYNVTPDNQACWVGGLTSAGASTFLSTGTYTTLGSLAANLTQVVQGLGGGFVNFQATAIGNQLNISSLAAATDFGISFALAPPTPPPNWTANPFTAGQVLSNAVLLGGVYGQVYGGQGAPGNAGLLPNPAGITDPIFGSQMTFSTVQVADSLETQKGSVSSLTVSSINGGVALLEGGTGGMSTFAVSSLVASLAGISTLFVGDVAGAAIASQILNFSTIQSGVGRFSSLEIAGPSTIRLSTSATAGSQAQPLGRLMIGGSDLDLGQQDLWCQQIRLGAGNATNAQSEIIFYDAAAGQRGLQTALQDRTIRVVSTINGTTGGYLLDTNINAPFFSTINAGTSTALFAFFPSTVNSTIGASTLSVIPNPIFVAAAASLSSQQVLAANTPLALDLGSATVNVGGFTLQRSTITVPVAGTYQLTPSIQFNTASGGANVVDFWVTKNGVDIPDSASRVSVANNAQQIGTVILYDTAAASDQYGIKIASADVNMSAGFFQSTVTTPYTRPAIPSIILNAQRIA